MESRLRIRNVRLCVGDGFNLCFNKVKVGDKCGHCIAEQRRARRKKYLRSGEAAQQRLLEQLYDEHLKLQHESELFGFAQDVLQHRDRIRKEREALHSALAGASQEAKVVFEELRQRGTSGGDGVPLIARPAAAAGRDNVPLLEDQRPSAATLSKEQFSMLVRYIRENFSSGATPAQLRAHDPTFQFSDELLSELIAHAYPLP